MEGYHGRILLLEDTYRKNMAKAGKKESIIKYKLAYTAVILLVYLLGRSLPLYGIAPAAYSRDVMDAEALMEQAISGDRYSLFALGISPYMIASILVQAAATCKRAVSRDRISPGKINRVMILLTLLFSGVQAAFRVQELPFREMAEPVFLVKLLAWMEMVAGGMVILWLAGRNKKYGIGGQTALIYINILDGLIQSIGGYTIRELLVPLGISAVALVVMIVMESGEKRIPVQRISIHNIYADKNYLAFKLNPVGVMPVMFATAFLMLPRLVLTGMSYLFPENGDIFWLQENLIMTKPLGIGAYIVTLYLLTIGFSMILISPGDMADQLLKSGDSLRDFHAGRDTRRYLVSSLIRISFFSATVLSLCLGAPMLLQLKGGIDRTLVMLPASVMMLTGIWYNLNQEYIVVKGYDVYRPFL
jgi:preprotein translocase subunit SecY